MSPIEKEQMLKDARVHLHFCLEVHRMQHEAGRYFLHAHLLSATSWKDTGVINIVGMNGAIKTRAHVQILDDANY